jgi:hypothetical protein
MFKPLSQRHLYLPIALILSLSLLLTASPIVAQGTETPESVPVDFMGTITGIAQNIMIVDNLFVVDLSNAAINVSLQAGLTVHVRGQLQGNTVFAEIVDIPSESTPTPALNAGPETTPEAVDVPVNNDVIVVVEGPVKAINVNHITVFNIDITVEPANPILTLIQVGDVIRAEGNFVNGQFVAVTVGNILGRHPGEASVAFEGPVQTINVNVVTINNINVQLDLSDPALANLQIGDVLHVEGDFHHQGGVFILVVVNVVIINNNVFLDCRRSAMGMVTCRPVGSAMGMGS